MSMLDLHSHILPRMDDGSRSVQESVAMLSALRDQGVDYVNATPHFYANENDPAEFLQRRMKAVERLATAWHKGLPGVRLGAEVHFFDGMSRVEELPSLCIQNTKLLLVEMPFFEPWTARMTAEVLEIGSRQGLQVILAHIERYLQEVPDGVWDELEANGVLFQCNASFFLRWQTKRKALHMLKEGRIHFLGSDCHDMDYRPPRMGEALSVIGPAGQKLLEDNIRRYFPALEE